MNVVLHHKKMNYFSPHVQSVQHTHGWPNQYTAYCLGVTCFVEIMIIVSNRNVSKHNCHTFQIGYRTVSLASFIPLLFWECWELIRRSHILVRSEIRRTKSKPSTPSSGIRKTLGFSQRFFIQMPNTTCFVFKVPSSRVSHFLSSMKSSILLIFVSPQTSPP